MHWKELVNSGLSRATGYKLVDAAKLAQPSAPAPKPRGGRALPKFYDAEARETIRAVKPRTMTAHEKVFALIVATRYVLDHQIPGAFVECGVWRGGSMMAVARTLAERGVDDRELHLFDTFEGMTEPTAEDRGNDGTPAATLLRERPKTAKVWAVAGLEDVQEGMAQTAYPAQRIHFHVGKVEDTIPANAPEQIALLRLDTDWYESTRHELEHLYDRVPSGGVLIIDDYGTWLGARQAVDEFLARTGARLLLTPVAAGRIAVKP
jgi:predicted O-methyltransferase YrrM